MISRSSSLYWSRRLRPWRCRWRQGVTKLVGSWLSSITSYTYIVLTPDPTSSPTNISIVKHHYLDVRDVPYSLPTGVQFAEQTEIPVWPHTSLQLYLIPLNSQINRIEDGISITGPGNMVWGGPQCLIDGIGPREPPCSLPDQPEYGIYMPQP